MTVPIEAKNIHGQWLSWLRHQLDCPLVGVAERLGTSPVVLGRYANGKSEPGTKMWRAIAALAGVDDATYWAGPPTRVAA